MNFSGSCYLGLRYLRRHRGKTVLLTAAITLSLILPLVVSQTVQLAEAHLRSRANSTPLLLGARGSELELAFNGLYFGKPDIATLPIGEARRQASGGLSRVIPIHARYRAQGYPIVGTSLDYFGHRGLRLSEGRFFTRLGDCVLGAEVAKRLNLGPGDRIVSTPEALFDLAGVYPLRMRITGVLAPAGNADDRAVFADVKTAWVISGLSHGHQEASGLSDDQVLERDAKGNIALNASVKEYTEITEDNVGTFHFHGDPDTFPITSALLLPRDEKAETILLGRFQDDALPTQLLRPASVMDDLFATVFQIRNVVLAALCAVALSAGAISLLVFALSNQLRRQEFVSLDHLGADRATVRFLVLFEAGFVMFTSVAIALAVTSLLHVTSPYWIPLLTS